MIHEQKRQKNNNKYDSNQMNLYKIKIINILQNNQKYLKWIFVKWGCNKKLIDDILTKMISWSGKKNRKVEILPNQHNLLKTIKHNIFTEIKNIIKSNQEKTIIYDTLEYTNEVGDLVTPSQEVKYIEKSTQKIKWRDTFIDKLRLNPDILDLKHFLNNYDPEKRWEIRKSTTSKYIINWFKNICGTKIELGLVHYLQKNKIKCIKCNRPSILGCGGRNNPWSDCICTSCYTFYEIKSKENDKEIERVINSKTIFGGSYKHYICQKIDNIDHNILLISRETGIVWVDEIKKNMVLPYFTKHWKKILKHS